MAIKLNYSFEGRTPLEEGYNDINNDGIDDALLFLWNNKAALFISDDGKLPWGKECETTDWNNYFNNAFCVNQKDKNPWNEIRKDFGSYTLMVDKDGCGRFDSTGDWCYRAFDLNGDGAAEAEYYHLFPGEDWCPHSNKLVVNLDGQRDMSYLDFGELTYPDEQRYDEKNGKYYMNVHGSGFFVNSYSSYPVTSWETPIAWYDFDHDLKTNMVMRVADALHNKILCSGDIAAKHNDRYSGKVSEFEIAYELNNNVCEEKYHSLDMQLTFYNYKSPTLDYTKYNDKLPFIKPLAGSEYLYENIAATRLEENRQYLPYLDGYKLGMEHDSWDGVFLVFDEDDDDCRWEELFSNHEGDGEDDDNGWLLFSDRIGDRTEKDTDYKGKGQLYISRFDGKIHLYHAEYSNWEIDYLGLYKGSKDHKNTQEGPEPPAGMIYPCVRYLDTTGNGFIDTIEYATQEYKNEAATRKVTRRINLYDYADEALPHPDVCELFDPRCDVECTGFCVGEWDGNPLSEQLENSPVGNGYQKMHKYYGTVCDGLFQSAIKLYSVAKKHGLNISEPFDKNLKSHYTMQELLSKKELTVPMGYSRLLCENGRRDRYHNGYWLREKVFADMLCCDKLDHFTLEKLYYTARIDELCEYVDKTMSQE